MEQDYGHINIISAKLQNNNCIKEVYEKNNGDILSFYSIIG